MQGRTNGNVSRTSKRIILAVIAISLWISSAAANSAPALRLISGSVYLIESTDYVATNYVVYVGKHTVTVAGATWTPATARKLNDAIKAITDRPVTEVIDTSPDPEWAGGNAYWKSIGAKVLAVRTTAEMLRANWKSTADFMRDHPGEYPSGRISAPNEIVPNELDLQNGAVKILFLGGSHTPGDVFVYFPNEKILDAGSILKEQLGNVANADLSQYPKTLERLQSKDLKIAAIISGHWSPLHGPELIQRYLALLDQHAAQSK